MTSSTLSSRALNIPRSGIRDVFTKAESMPDAILLCVGEPSATAAPHIVEAACDSIRAGLTKYTDVLGIDGFREAASAYTSTVKGLSYAPENEIQAVDGATIGMFLALKAVVDSGGEVIIPSPFFTSYESEVTMCGGTPVTVALKPENQMRLNAEDIEAAVTPRTRAVIINSPGNPTGAVTPADELARIGEVCRRHNIWAISDEVYHPYVFAAGLHTAPSIAAAPGMKDHTIVVESLSKTYAMTGWRIGYLLAPAHVIELTSKMAELMHSSVNSTAQYAGMAALNGPQEQVEAMREEYRRKRQLVLDGLSGSATLSTIKPEGAFYAFVDIHACGMDAQTFSDRLLAEQHVAVVPGTAFGREGTGFVRVSYAGDADELREGVRRLHAFADQSADPAYNASVQSLADIEAIA